MAEHNYEIIIRTQGSGGSGGGTGEQTTPETASAEKGLMEQIAAVGKRVQKIWSATELGRSALSNGLQLVGVKQGSRDTQDRIDFGLSVAEQSITFLAAFAVNPVVGLTTVIGAGINFLGQYAQYSEDRKWNEFQRQYNLQRTGISWNRSRMEGM